MDKKTKKKPIGYTKEQTSSMKKLFERVDPKAGDYVGGGTVTEVKNKKKMKRMQMGGMAMMDRSSRFGRGPMGRMGRPASPGVSPVGSPGGGPFKSKNLTGMRPDPVTGMMPTPVPRVGETVPRRTLKGGGLARKGVGMALAKGGIVKAPARSYKDMKAGAGSGVGLPYTRPGGPAKPGMGGGDVGLPYTRPGGPAKPGMGGGDVGLPYIRPGFTVRTPGGPAKPGMGGGDVGLPYTRPGFTAKTPGGPAIIPDRRTMKGGGLARKGVGMALAKGGIVKAPARSYKDMMAGAGSGVGRIQKTKIQRGR